MILFYETNFETLGIIFVYVDEMTINYTDCKHCFCFSLFGFHLMIGMKHHDGQ